MTIAVTGASGQLGRLALHALKTRTAGDEIIALVRTPGRITDAKVSERAFDYDNATTLATALAGVDTLAFISSSEIGKRVAQHRNVIEAARDAGVERIVYTSVLHADTSPLSVATEHVPTEAAIRASGLPYTILRNGWYTENYMGSVAPALANDAWIGSSGAGRISAASRADYAEALAVVATADGHNGAVYELAGDDAFTLADLAAELSRQIGRDIPYRDLPEAEYAAALTAAGVPGPFARTLAGWEVDASHDALFDQGRQLSSLIGRPTTPLSATVAAALSQNAGR
ncbi:SDR family oxidoreductase [uncultured Sphingomonas sp.]|uniref:SDR family oxidoreductase n=1 Tax=uncultured Sphingomonas sp. TaxID=158754 RepID=UPI0035CA8EC1